MDPAILLAMGFSGILDLVWSFALGSRGTTHISLTRTHQHNWSHNIWFDVSRRQEHDNVLIIAPAPFVRELFMKRNIFFAELIVLSFHDLWTSMELQLSRQIKQSSISVISRNSRDQGQLRTDAGEVGGDDDPPYDLCNNILWRWMEKQSIGLESLYRKCLVVVF